MAPRNAIQSFYEQNPRMVSSPFGGVEGMDEALFRAVLERLDIALPGKRTLDIGCGRGYAENVIAAAGGEYFGADFVCSRKGFRLALADAARLPFHDAAFDLALCVDAYEHFPDGGRAAAEIFRVLRPGGVFFLSAPNYANIAGLVKRIHERAGWSAPNTWAPFGRWQPQEWEQCVTPGSIRRQFRAAGFRAIRAVGYAPETGLGLFPWMDHPAMPDAIRFRLQRLFRAAGPALITLWPGSSLHLFWRMERP